MHTLSREFPHLYARELDKAKQGQLVWEVMNVRKVVESMSPDKHYAEWFKMINKIQNCCTRFELLEIIEDFMTRFLETRSPYHIDNPIELRLELFSEAMNGIDPESGWFDGQRHHSFYVFVKSILLQFETLINDLGILPIMPHRHSGDEYWYIFDCSLRDRLKVLENWAQRHRDPAGTQDEVAHQVWHHLKNLQLHSLVHHVVTNDSAYSKSWVAYARSFAITLKEV